MRRFVAIGAVFLGLASAPSADASGSKSGDLPSYKTDKPPIVLPSAAIPPNAGDVTPLSGSRAQQLAALLRNIAMASQSRDWAGTLAAFPGARWQGAQNHQADWYGSTRTQAGTIALAGARYDIRVAGTRDRVQQIYMSSPGDDLVEWDAVAAALPATGVQPRNIGCHSPTGFGYVRLTLPSGSVVLHKSLNYGSRVASTDEYAFVLDNPFDGRSEAEVAADTSLC